MCAFEVKGLSTPNTEDLLLEGDEEEGKRKRSPEILLENEINETKRSSGKKKKNSSNSRSKNSSSNWNSDSSKTPLPPQKITITIEISCHHNEYEDAGPTYDH